MLAQGLFGGKARLGHEDTYMARNCAGCTPSRPDPLAAPGSAKTARTLCRPRLALGIFGTPGTAGAAMQGAIGPSKLRVEQFEGKSWKVDSK